MCVLLIAALEWPDAAVIITSVLGLVGIMYSVFHKAPDTKGQDTKYGERLAKVEERVNGIGLTLVRLEDLLRELLTRKP